MNSVVKGASYVLVHAPDMLVKNGTTQTTERIVNPNSEYLKTLGKHLRSYDDAVAYLPNQVYIGNLDPVELRKHEQPWYGTKFEDAARYGRFGEIMPQAEFYFLIQACDEFELVRLEKGFVGEYKDAFFASPVVTDLIRNRIHDGVDAEQLEKILKEDGEGLYLGDRLVGAVKKAHDVDLALSSHVLLENLVSKASHVLSLLHLVDKAGISPAEVDYVIDCSEEACGDMNQRGGGNFAKASAEIAGFSNATGIDTRGFCASPVHALTIAASLVKAGTYKNVVVSAGGSTAKLGMNGKDHIKKDMPLVEDVIGGFAVWIGEDDGKNPIIDLDHVGRHTVGTGSSPQAVITSLVSDPLQKAGLKITDIDIYSPEMQNPDCTKPAGAGDVPVANLKMIAALGVKQGILERKDINDFVEKHGVPGFAPTQGHIPSGVPFIGYGREALLNGAVNRIMIVGKGSLFLGRLTNLFDGVSFMMLPNEGKVEETGKASGEELRKIVAESLRGFAKSLLSEDQDE
ncbi:MAG TPA: glycine reductase [Clostridiaceae bacterium]|nr:glycine reductase [Clostridiaceae bacterium]